MSKFFIYLQDIGTASLSALWFPLLLWTLLSLALLVALRFSRNVDPLYHYYLRIALFISLPASLIGYHLADTLSSRFSGTDGFIAPLIVVANPISVPATTSTATTYGPAWGEPGIWLGMVIGLLALGSLAGLAFLLRRYSILYRFVDTLSDQQLLDGTRLTRKNREFMESIKRPVKIFESSEISVPFTFGWQKPVIILPETLGRSESKQNMVIRHELLHIRRHDFLFKVFSEGIKMLFWFHPILHKLDEHITEYRELSCDGEVLRDRTISKKDYAALLFELAPKTEIDPYIAVNMAATSSTLKKRIKQMNLINFNSRPTSKSLLLSLVVLAGTVLFVSCSDLTNDGITRSEVDQIQGEIANSSESDSKPLYILNGERLEPTNENRTLLSRIKPEYIRNIEVIKGQKATKEYGPDGKHGVIKITLTDKEIALNDLRTSKTIKEQPLSKKGSAYVSVEEMPELIGGLQSLQERVDYPEMASKARIEGTVMVSFIVNKKGEVENPRVIKGIGGGCDEEALEAVKQAKFTPGKQRGEPVRVQFSLPIIFRLG